MKRLLSTLALAALVLTPAIALAADTTGAAGMASALRINTPSSSTYIQYHGSLVVTGTRAQEYRWGGTSCGSLTLSSENLSLLHDAVQTGLEVIPYYQTGQGSTRCLVGFTSRPASSGGGKTK